MSDEPVTQQEPTPEVPVEAAPVAEQPRDQWGRWTQAGVDPESDDAFKAYQIGQSIYDVNTRRDAIEDVIRQDPQLRTHLERMFAPQHQTPAAHDPEGFALMGPQSDQPTPAYVTPEEMQAQMQDMRIENMLLTQLNTVQGLNEQQRAEVYNRAWGRYTQGEYTNQSITTAIQSELDAIRNMWGSPPPPPPGLDTAQQIAQQHAGAPAPGVDTGSTPGGEAPIESLNDSANRARAIIEAQQRGY